MKEVGRVCNASEYRHHYMRSIMTTPATLLVVLTVIQYRNQVDTVVLVFIMQRTEWINGIMQHFCHQMLEFGKRMKKAQKLTNLEDVDPEIEEGSLEVEKNWPKLGNIEFQNVYLRYRPKTELVLKGLNFKIKAGSKIGVVGRTGAGKSTLGLAIARIMEVESGAIKVDDVDIS